MSISSWVLERSCEEDLQLQTKETADGFRVASRGLLAMPGRDGADICRAVYCMEFEMQASIFLFAAHVTFICFCDAFWRAARSGFRMFLRFCSRGAVRIISWPRQMHHNLFHAAYGFFSFTFHFHCDSLNLRADHPEASLTYLN